MSDKRNNAIALSALAKMIAERLPVKVSEGVVFEVLKKHGEISAELLEAGTPIMLPEVGVVKPITIKGRVYPNPRGGEPKQVGDRKGIRIDLVKALKQRFGR